jgi:hypothetical protein
MPRRVFLVAGIYGIVVLLPQYFIEMGLPEPMARPEHFYGFIGVALAWQFAFLLIATDVQRYRPLMLVGVLEKLSFGLAVLVLYALGRVSAGVLGAGVIDLALGALFALAFRHTAMAHARLASTSVFDEAPERGSCDRGPSEKPPPSREKKSDHASADITYTYKSAVRWPRGLRRRFAKPL